MPKKEISGNWVVFSILTLGFAEILTQLVLAREFMSVFYGNELVIGILLSNWLLIGGIGSYFGRWVRKVDDKHRLLITLHLLIAVLLPAAVYIIRDLYNFAFIRGELPGVMQIYVTTFLILLPTCLITGFSLPLFSVLYSKRNNPGQVGTVYLFDSLSNIIGGIVFSFILVYLLDSFQIALIVLAVNLIAAIILSVKTGKTAFTSTSAALLLLGTSLFLTADLNMLTTQQQYPSQQVLAAKDSPYGRLVVTRTAGQINFYEDGTLLFSTDDPQSTEEKVHYTLLQRPNAKRVLLISGGVSGTALEVLKHDVDSIDYIELDPVIVEAGKQLTHNLDDPRINIIETDARMFIRQTAGTQGGRRYDAAVIDMPSPSTARSNRLYTEEFYKELKKTINPGGAVGIHISSSSEYADKATTLLDSAVYNSLKAAFENVLVLPGDDAYLVASDGQLSYGAYYDIKIDTSFVKAGYIDERLDNTRIESAVASLNSRTETNKDFRPVAYYYHLLYWLEHFETNYYIFIALIAAFLLLVLWRINSTGFALFSAGLSGIALELIIIFGFQAIYGYAYGKIGIIITSFMIGLAAGAWQMNRRKNATRKTVSSILLMLAALSSLLPALLFAMSKITPSNLADTISSAIFPLITAASGYLVGLIFPAATRTGFKDAAETSSRMFFYDYAGACAGALLVSALLVPLIGTIWTCIAVSVLCIAASAIIRIA